MDKRPAGPLDSELDEVPPALRDTVKYLISRKVEARVMQEMDALRAEVRAELGQ